MKTSADAEVSSEVSTSSPTKKKLTQRYR